MSYILVAEDDPSIQLLVRRKLENAGFQVRATADGNDALAMAAAELPAIMLLDVMIPGCNGLEVCRQIKARYGQAAPPVIIISARGQKADVDAGEQVGADDYLIKPFIPRELLEHVNAMLRRPKRVTKELPQTTPQG
jgi:two-component system phosphate regulon response regulator PhoB